jgi:hypothetical protein
MLGGQEKDHQTGPGQQGAFVSALVTSESLKNCLRNANSRLRRTRIKPPVLGAQVLGLGRGGVRGKRLTCLTLPEIRHFLPNLFLTYA